MNKSLKWKIARWCRNAVLILVAAIAAAIWQFGREVPSFVRVRLEQALSQGIFCVRFDRASVSLGGGICIRDVRIYVKRTLGPPLITIGKMRLGGSIHRDRPFYTWINAVEADDFVCHPFLDLPDSESGGVDLAAYLRLSTIDHDWFSDPIRISIRNADIFAIKCEKLDFQLRAVRNVVTAGGIQAEFKSRGFDESLSGWASFSPTPCEIQARLHGTLTPEVVENFITFMDGETANAIARRTDNYSAPLQVSGEVLWRSAADGVSPPTQDFRATARGGGLTYRGVPLRDLQFGVQWLSTPLQGGGRRRRLTVAPVEFVFEEGKATVSIAWHPDTHATDIHADATAKPEELAQAVWGRVPSVVTNFTFGTLADISLGGSVMPDGFAEKTAVKGKASVAAATARGVPMEDVSFDFGVHGDDILDFTNISARVFGGPLTGYVRVADYEDDPFLDLSLSVSGADCLAARRHFLHSDLEGGGFMDCDVSIRGPADSRRLADLTGSAGLSIRGGNILRFPLFAGLTDFIGRNVPGVDLLLMQSDANVSCTLTNGLATIDRIDVSGNLFSMVASGRCRINKEGIPIDMLAQLRFFHSQSLIGKLARLVTLPVSKMMEFRVTGPITDPEWSYIGIIDRIRSIFWTREDATAIQDDSAKPAEGAGEGSK